MCGITGIIEFRNKKVNRSELLKMQNALKHRGPDGSGMYIKKSVGLAMRRLSIIDVVGGDQPLFNEDGSIAIVGNGEIYNYVELQKELERKGHKARTRSDIETAIHAYEEWGEKAFEKFRGMFALAMYDVKKNLVYLIRDRMGEKPLYYSQISKKIIFGSELKSIISTNKIDKTLDLNAINNFFHFYYIPEPDTSFMSVKKLQSGAFIKIDLNKSSFTITKYWDPQKIKIDNSDDPINSLKKIFKKACELTLRSDVPVGISLSGGIDSSSILAISAPKYKGNLKAFSVGYEGNPLSDERQMAKGLAKKYNVKFFEKEIKVKDVVNHFPKLIWQCDEPIADIAAHSIYEVSKLARKNGVKVLLNGAGGDELFWGYPSTIESAIKNTEKNWFKKLFNDHFFYNNPNPEAAGLIIEKLYSNEFTKKVDIKSYNNMFSSLNKKTPVKNVIDTVRDVWLKNDVVTLGDRISMANSVELRAPYLDYKLIEYVLSSKKLVNGYTLSQKYYQKKMFNGILSKEILDRPKRGFTPPVSKWISEILKKYSYLLKNGFLVKEKIIDKTKINLITKVITSIPTYAAYQLLVMEIWGRLYVYNEKIK